MARAKPLVIECDDPFVDYEDSGASMTIEVSRPDMTPFVRIMSYDDTKQHVQLRKLQKAAAKGKLRVTVEVVRD